MYFCYFIWSHWPKPYFLCVFCFILFEWWREVGASEIAPQVSNLLCSLPRSLGLLAALPNHSPWILLPCSYITTATGAWDVMSTTASTLLMGYILSHPTRKSISHHLPKINLHHFLLCYFSWGWKLDTSAIGLQDMLLAQLDDTEEESG